MTRTERVIFMSEIDEPVCTGYGEAGRVDSLVMLNPCDKCTNRLLYAHQKMLNFDRDIQDLCERAWTDSARLEWLLRHVSGAEFRRLGIIYSADCTRHDIDNAMRAYHPQDKA